MSKPIITREDTDLFIKDILSKDEDFCELFKLITGKDLTISQDDTNNLSSSIGFDDGCLWIYNEIQDILAQYQAGIESASVGRSYLNYKLFYYLCCQKIRKALDGFYFFDHILNQNLLFRDDLKLLTYKYTWAGVFVFANQPDADYRFYFTLETADLSPTWSSQDLWLDWPVIVYIDAATPNGRFMKNFGVYKLRDINKSKIVELFSIRDN